MNNIQLLNNVMRSNSAARRFYFIMARKSCSSPRLLNNRVKKVCCDHNLNFQKVLWSDTYVKDIKGVLLCNTKNNMDGTVDSLRYLINNSDQYSIKLMRLLLKAF